VVLGVAPLPEGAPVHDGDGRLNSADDPVAVLRVEAREDLVIASETAAVM